MSGKRKIVFTSKAPKTRRDTVVDIFRSFQSITDNVRKTAGNPSNHFTYQCNTRFKFERCARLFEYTKIVRHLVEKDYKCFTIDQLKQLWPEIPLIIINRDIQSLGIYIDHLYTKIPAGALLSRTRQIVHTKGTYVTQSNQYGKVSVKYSKWVAKRRYYGQSSNPPNVPKPEYCSRTFYGELSHHIQINIDLP